MATVTALEAKTRFGRLLNRVARGEEVIITRHERPVARLIPEGPGRLDHVRAAISRLRELRSQIAARNKGKPKFSYVELRSAIEEGRR